MQHKGDDAITVSRTFMRDFARSAKHSHLPNQCVHSELMWESYLSGIVTIGCRDCAIAFLMQTCVLHRRSFHPLPLKLDKERKKYFAHDAIELDLSRPLRLASQRDAYGVYKGVIMRELGGDVGGLFCAMVFKVCLKQTNNWIRDRINNMHCVPGLMLEE